MSHFLSVSFSMIRGGHNYSKEWKPPQRAWWKEWAVLCIRGHTGPAEDTKATSICVFHTLQLCRHPPATHTHTQTYITHLYHIHKDSSSGKVYAYTLLLLYFSWSVHKEICFFDTMKAKQRLKDSQSSDLLFQEVSCKILCAFVISMGWFFFLQVSGRQMFHLYHSNTFVLSVSSLAPGCRSRISRHRE